MTLVKSESREVVGGAQSLDHWLLISALLIMPDWPHHIFIIFY